MTGADEIFAGTIPAIYERHMVPMIFEPYAQDTAARVARLQPRKLLEIAAGTGVVTRALAARLGKAAEIVATDLNGPMLDLAIRLQGDGGRVTFQQADALALPFADDSFDAAVCQFGVMFFPDKLRGYREARRVLKPGGTYLLAVWDVGAPRARGLRPRLYFERLWPIAFSIGEQRRRIGRRFRDGLKCRDQRVHRGWFVIIRCR